MHTTFAEASVPARVPIGTILREPWQGPRSSQVDMSWNPAPNVAVHVPVVVQNDTELAIDVEWLRAVLQQCDHAKIPRLLALLKEEWLEKVNELRPMAGHPVDEKVPTPFTWFP